MNIWGQILERVKCLFIVFWFTSVSTGKPKVHQSQLTNVFFLITHSWSCSNDGPLPIPQMAKNRGLTPRRKKIDRNPRVKHREKFRRANIRRKGQVCIPHIDETIFIPLFKCIIKLLGTVSVCRRISLTQEYMWPCQTRRVPIHQVREVRREETRYSGEWSGIRAGVKKSVKLK